MTRPHSPLEACCSPQVFCFFFGIGAVYAADQKNEIPVESAIDHVVVYEQGAQIERLANVSFAREPCLGF